MFTVFLPNEFCSFLRLINERWFQTHYWQSTVSLSHACVRLINFWIIFFTIVFVQWQHQIRIIDADKSVTSMKHERIGLNNFENHWILCRNSKYFHGNGNSCLKLQHTKRTKTQTSEKKMEIFRKKRPIMENMKENIETRRQRDRVTNKTCDVRSVPSGIFTYLNGWGHFVTSYQITPRDSVLYFICFSVHFENNKISVEKRAIRVSGRYGQANKGNKR